MIQIILPLLQKKMNYNHNKKQAMNLPFSKFLTVLSQDTTAMNCTQSCCFSISRIFGPSRANIHGSMPLYLFIERFLIKKRKKKIKRERMSTVGAEVRYVSTSTILPATNHIDHSSQQMELTPWDLCLLPHETIQKGLLFIKPKDIIDDEQNNIDVINHLKTSFSQALDHFYPLAGRLATKLHEEDNTISVYINCNSTGAEFIHATADITLSSFLNPTYIPHIVNSFFPQNGVINYDGRTNPLISVQVTELIDGIFIGCSVNHSACDGTSFWHFFNSWSEISRSSTSSSELHNQISRPPVLERWFLKESDSPIRLPFDLINDERFNVKQHLLPPLQQRVFHFSPQNLASLKSKANSNSQSGKISSLQALLAHFWVAVTRARCIDPNEETRYQLLIGSRGRLSPPLSEEYFGNSIMLGMATAKAGELLEKGIVFGGLLMNQMIKSYNEEYIRSSWESWMEKPKLPFPNIISNTLVTGSSPRFDMYGNDFGWGKPIAVRSGCASKRDGKLTVFPGAVEGSMDIEASLSPETLKALGDDTEFMKDVTILPAF